MYYHVEGQGFTCVTPINTNVSCIHKSPHVVLSVHPLVCFCWAASAFAVLHHSTSACREGAWQHSRSSSCFHLQKTKPPDRAKCSLSKQCLYSHEQDLLVTLSVTEACSSPQLFWCFSPHFVTQVWATITFITITLNAGMRDELLHLGDKVLPVLFSLTVFRTAGDFLIAKNCDFFLIIRLLMGREIYPLFL